MSAEHAPPAPSVRLQEYPLAAEQAIGLIDALEKFEPARGNKFETSMIETARAELEEMLEKFAGRRIALVPEFAQAPAQGAQEFSAPEDTGSEEPTMADLSDEEASQDAPPAPKSPHAPRQVVAGTEPELKHLAKVFHGRITRIDKVK